MKSLAAHYTKDGARIIFTGNKTLSEVALQMWEHLGFQKMDASVLSRVLKGERLFTPSQLQAFCSVLRLTSAQEEALFHCLAQDYFKRDNIIITSHISSQQELASVLERLVGRAMELFYEGKSQEVIRQSDLIDTLFERITIEALSPRERFNLIEQYGYYLFLRERSIAGTYDPKSAARSIARIAKFLEKLSHQYSLQNLHAYAQLLLADICYMQGAHQLGHASEVDFTKSLQHAHTAFKQLPEDHREKLAALRLMVASSCYLHDEETVRFAEAMTNKLLPAQSMEHAVNALHLSKILTKGKVMVGDMDPFAIEEKVRQHITTMPNTDGIYYQLSDIKTRIETFSLFKLKDKTVIVPLIEKGLQLVAQGKYPRHKKFLDAQIRLVS